MPDVTRRTFSRFFFPLVVLLALAWLAANAFWDGDDDTNRVLYSEAISRVESQPQEIELVTFHPRSQRIELRLRGGATLETNYPSDESQVRFEELLHRQDVPFDSESAGTTPIWTLLSTLLPFILLFGFWIFLMQRTKRDAAPAPEDDLRTR